ncbi:MAG: tetratricopeptide repeat protein [Pseudomonadota bacterium]
MNPLSVLTDLYGNPITLGDRPPDGAADRDVATAWGDAAQGILAHQSSAAAKLDYVLEHAPNFALAWAVKGWGCMLLGRRELVSEAAAAYAQAKTAAGVTAISVADQLVIDALGLVIAGRWRAGADLLDQALNQTPNSALLVKLSHACRFILGDARGMRRSIENVLDAYDDKHPHAGYVYGCYAFALEETNDYQAAESWGRRGLEINPDDAWGLHAVAHVYEMQVDPDAGYRWVMDNKPAWQASNNFKIHVWWHVALFLLEQGDHEGVLTLYDSEIRADQTDDYRDIANGASLLMRLELDGVDVGTRWEELADLSETRIDDACLAFADMHYLMSLTGSKRWEAAERMIARLEDTSDHNLGDLGVVTRHAAAPMGKVLLAFQKGDSETAAAYMKAVDDQLYRIGGSHAQRDVFRRVLTDAAIAAGSLDIARKILKERAMLRGGVDRFSTSRMKAARYSEPAAGDTEPAGFAGDRLFG